MTRLRQANGRRPGNQKHCGTLPAILFSALWLLHSGGVMAQPGAAGGSIKGQVMVADSSGSSYVPGALIVLTGPANLNTQSDANGQYSFSSVPTGTYTVQATAPGLATQQSVTVDPGVVLTLSLQLQVAATTTNVTVTASSANSDIATAAQTVTFVVVAAT